MTETTKVATEMPERLWIDELPRGYVVHADEWQEHDFDATEYVRADVVKEEYVEAEVVQGWHDWVMDMYWLLCPNCAFDSVEKAIAVIEDRIRGVGRGAEGEDNSE